MSWKALQRLSHSGRYGIARVYSVRPGIGHARRETGVNVRNLLKGAAKIPKKYRTGTLAGRGARSVLFCTGRAAKSTGDERVATTLGYSCTASFGRPEEEWTACYRQPACLRRWRQSSSCRQFPWPEPLALARSFADQAEAELSSQASRTAAFTCFSQGRHGLPITPDARDLGAELRLH